uniref:Putative m13 family peptidase n=1 Tax=Ixodes ricinus TaxID=34613 RepID=A0A0K8RHV0_IXORI
MQANKLWWLFAALQAGWSIVVPPSDRNNVCTTKECNETATRILSGMKSTIDPCNDFYEFVCGSYISNTEIPSQRTAINRFVETMMKLEREMEHFINSNPPAGGEQTPRKKMYYIFKSCKKPDTTEANEVKNLKAVFKDRGFASWPKVALTASQPKKQYYVINEQGWNGLFGISVEVNYFNPGTYAIFATTEDSRIDPKNNRKMTTLKEVEKLIRELPWKTILQHPFQATKTTLRDTQSIVIWRLKYYKSVSRLISQKTPELLSNYLGWKQIVQLLPYTRSTLYTKYSQFMGSVDASFDKVSAQANCINQLMKNMKFVFGDLYTSAYFKLDVLADISEMITYLKESLTNLLEERQKDWLDSKTRSAAIKKVRDMYQLIGYPNWIKKPSELQSLYQFLPLVSSSMSYVSLMNMTLHNNFYANLKQLPTTVDRNKVFPQDPAVVNGEYIPYTNALVLYAGLLRSPFYEKNIPIAVKMGATGWNSAHELTHGLDTFGSQFDATGKLTRLVERRRAQEVPDYGPNCYNQIQYSELIKKEQKEN